MAENVSPPGDSSVTTAAISLNNLTLSSPVGEEIKKIVDLPEWAIREVVDFVPNTSRALLALALTTDSACWRDIHWDRASPKSILEWFRTGPASISKVKKPSAITKAILLPKNEDEEDFLWKEINFEDNEKALCERLTDDDIAGMLACINSVQRLKRIYLTNCYNITGRALEPLRGSTVLERIDLSLRPRCGYDHVQLSTLRWGGLLQIHVLPILQSIIDREHHSLKHIQFPNFDFVDLREKCGYFQQFLLKYDESGHHRNAVCRNCSVDCNRSLSIFRDDNKDYIGIQKYTCYDCLNHYCYNCKDEDEDDQFYLSFCKMCEKWRCKDCQVMQACRACVDFYGGRENDAIDDHAFRNNVSFICKDCIDENHYCGQCGDVFCPDCQPYFLLSCGVCKKRGCTDCMDVLYCEHESCELGQCDQCRDVERDTERGISYCSMCDSDFCFKHRLEECKRDWRNSCGECLRILAPTLARAYEERNPTSTQAIELLLPVIG